MFVLLDRAFARSRAGTSPRCLSEALRVLIAVSSSGRFAHNPRAMTRNIGLQPTAE